MEKNVGEGEQKLSRKDFGLLTVKLVFKDRH